MSGDDGWEVVRVRLLLVALGALGLVAAACDGGGEGDLPGSAPTVVSTGSPTTVGRQITAPSTSATPTTSAGATSTAASTSVPPGSTGADGSYLTLDLGVLPGTSMAYALDINDDGLAVGVGFLPADGEAISVAVWWPDLTSGPQRLDVELGLDQWSGSRALRVNDGGQILVSGGGRLVLADPAAGFTQEVLVPFAERPIVLFEAGLNNPGDIVGSVVVDEVDTGEGVYAITHAFRWSAATLEAVDLGTLPGTESSHAYDINDAGQIVGDSAGQPFVWDPVAGVMTALDIPANPGQISLMRINNAGLVLASPAVWDLKTDALVSAGPSGIAAYDINDAGLVAASVTDSCPACAGITWDPFTGTTRPLEAAAANPLAINSSGDVVGTSNARATLWTRAR